MIALNTVDILGRLVAYPTVSRDTNIPLIDWVRNFLADYGIDSRLIPDATGCKANLFASIGPMDEGGLVLSGHTDVVPIDGQGWGSDPFSLTPRGSRLHGRGTCDMKGFIAAALSRAPSWISAGLARPVHLMLSYDEELGCLGAPAMIAAASEVVAKPAAVIVGEPTGLRVANQHKGICVIRTHVTGVEAHSSLTDQGVSAIMVASELIAYLNKLSRALAQDSARGESTEHSEGLSHAKRFEPPYTTLSVNRVEGGTANNILAATCDFLWDIRALPGDSPQSILDELASFARRLPEDFLKTCHVESKLCADVPALHADGGAAEQLVRAATQLYSDPIAVPFATEAGQFQRAGWSTVVCGPGSIEQAHKADEFIERSELMACEGFLDRAVARICSE